MYQLLWSLLRATRVRFLAPELDGQDQLTGTTIILEPSGGGGDLVVVSDKSVVVEQLKARPSGDTWSLKEVIESVIPDLYMAADYEHTAQYRFVTEGRMGGWKAVYEFFNSLRTRAAPTDSPLSDLDDVSPIPFRKDTRPTKDPKEQDAFWDLEQYTEKTLYEKIVSVIRARPSVHRREDVQTTQKRLRSILANFEFVGEQGMLQLKREIDSHLYTVVGQVEDIPMIRDSLALEIGRKATEGGAEVDCQELFRSHNLNAVPLTAWSQLRSASHKIASETLGLLGYENECDVRVLAAQEMLDKWPATSPILIVTGESGSGKSWRSYAACSEGQSQRSLFVVVTAGSNVDITLKRAADTVWNQIAGHDISIPLSQIARRVRGVVGDALLPWLTIIIDGSIDHEQATELIAQRWEEMGIRLVMALPPQKAQKLQEQSRGRCSISHVSDFSIAELQDYLALFLGDSWPDMPDFVRNPLKKPLMASIYKELAGKMAGWTPYSEYELFNAYWERVLAQEPLDRLLLVRLAEKYLVDGSYPWSTQDVASLGGDNQALRRLESSGWLRISATGTDLAIEAGHLRLLNWACAVSLLGKLERNEESLASTIATLKSLLRGDSRPHARTLGFVPMDFLWLACRSPQARPHVAQIIGGLESDHAHTENLYRDLIPTLGEDVLFALEEQVIEASRQDVIHSLAADSIASIGGEKAASIGCTLLGSTHPPAQIASLAVLTANPSGSALDQLWALHNSSQSAPQNYLPRVTPAHRHLLYDKTFAALRECCRVNPEWLDRKLESLQPESELVSDLVYLLGNIKVPVGQGIWQRHKTRLLATVPSEKQRCIAMCIDKFADRELVDWLVDKVEQRTDLLGPAALRALVRLAPDRAVEELSRIPTMEFELTTGWFCDHLFAIVPDAARAKLREVMRERDPWSYAHAYEGRMHYLDVETLEILLGDLGSKLSTALAEPNWGDREPLLRELMFLNKINSHALICRLERERDSDLESKLVELLLRIGPRSGRGTDSLTRQELIGILHKINGEGICQAVNCLLESDSRYGRLDGLRWARKKADTATLELLTAITRQEDDWEGAFFEQCEAAEILAAHSEWEPVISLVRQIGLKTLCGLTDLAREDIRPDRAHLEDVYQSVQEKGSESTPGDLLAIGFGPIEFAELVKRVASDPSLDPERQRACVIALDLLGDNSSDAIPFLVSQVQSQGLVAINAILHNGTTEALSALANIPATDDPSNAESVITARLMSQDDRRAGALETAKDKIVRKIEQGRCWEFSLHMLELADRVKQFVSPFQLFNDSRIENFLRAESFADENNAWHTGKKYAAIRCLAYIDKHAAIIATNTVLRSPRLHDREMFPSLLVEFDEVNAYQTLFDLLRWEESEFMQSSICRALAQLPIEARLLRDMQSHSVETRRISCLLASWMSPTEALHSSLLARTSDSDDTVARTASSAMSSALRRKQSLELQHALLECRDDSKKWLLVDCLLNLDDPGDRFHRWPTGGLDISDALSTTQWEYLSEQLAKRRKKLREKDRRL